MNVSTIRKTHISWHITAAATGLVLGVAVVPYVSINIGTDVLLVALISSFIVSHKLYRYMIGFSLVIGMIVGYWRGSMERNALAKYEPLYKKSIVLSGMVKEDVSFGPNGDLRVRLNNIEIENTKFSGSIWASISSSDKVMRGDIVRIEGTLSQGFGNTSATMYRATLIELRRPYPGDIGRRVRDRFSEAVVRVLPSESAGLGLGFLLGQKQFLDDEISQKIRSVGLAHVVVASGYHLTLLVEYARRPFIRFSKYLATASASAMIIGFSLITGFTPSMARASLVSFLGLMAWYYGRKFHPVTLLMFAAAVTLIIQPSYIWGDIGWYLSFVAFGGVLILAPLIQRYFWGHVKAGMVRELLITSLAAQLVTLPIVILSFKQYSVYSVLSNILIVPLVPLAMLLTFLVGVTSLLLPSLAIVIAQLCRWLLEYMLNIVSWVANLPNSSTEIEFGLMVVALAYAAIIVMTVFLWRRTKYDFRNPQNIVLPRISLFQRFHGGMQRAAGIFR